MIPDPTPASTKLMAILNRHLVEAKAAVEFHRPKQRLHNMDALFAALKVSWLKAIIKEVEGAQP